MEYFICKKAKKIVSTKICKRNASANQCHDANGLPIICGHPHEAAQSKRYTADEVFTPECAREYKSVCMAEH